MSVSGPSLLIESTDYDYKRAHLEFNIGVLKLNKEFGCNSTNLS